MAEYYKPNPQFWQQFGKAVVKAQMSTAYSINTDVNATEVVPMDHGFLQASAHTYVLSDGMVLLQYNMPYAVYQYFDASLRHDKGPHAGTATSHWLNPYLPNGAKNAWVQVTFVKHLRKYMSQIV